MQSIYTLLPLASFTVTTPEIIYPFTALAGQFSNLLIAGYNDDPVDSLILSLDFSEDGATPDSDLRITATIPALGARIIQVPDLRVQFVRVTVESGKAGHASVSGRRQMTAWRRV